MSAENSPFYMKLPVALNISRRIIHDKLKSIYGDHAPCLRTVEQCCKMFREGREEVEDKQRSSILIIEATFENIERIHLLIDDDPYRTINELQYETD